MNKFQAMDELIAYMVGSNSPKEVYDVAVKSMQNVEECNKNGATAYLCVAATRSEAEQIEAEYSLLTCVPESDESIDTTNGENWHVFVYVFSDDGGGIVYLKRSV